MCAGSKEAYDDLLNEEKEYAVKYNLVINEIAQKENISISEEEYKEKRSYCPRIVLAFT